MPKMTGVFRARKGQAGDEVAYLPILNAVIQFVNVVTGKQQLAVETGAGGAYSFNIPIGKYTVGAYIKGGAPIFNTICAGASWEVYADSPSNSFDEFVINPNDGDVDGALLEQFKRLSELAQQGAISSQQSAEQALINNASALKKIDTEVWKETATYAFGPPISCMELPAAVVLAKLTDGPSSPNLHVYIRRLKYSDARYLLFVEEYPTESPRSWVTSVTDGVLGKWQPSGSTKMKENGLWDLSKAILPSQSLLSDVKNGLYYIPTPNVDDVEHYPEGDFPYYVQVHTRSSSNALYNTLDITRATGSMAKYRMHMLNGVWQPPMQYHMNRIGDQSFTAWRAADLPARMVGWYVMSGDNILLSSRVGQNLNSLPQTYKDDWGIKVMGDNINIPNWFHEDGRGYHARASLTPGARLEDAMEKMTGQFATPPAFSSSSGGGSGVFAGNFVLETGVSTLGVSTAVGRARYVLFDNSEVARTANETRGMSIGFLPIIYLGV